MSADNGYSIRQRSDLMWVGVYLNMSADRVDIDLYGPRYVPFRTIEEVQNSLRGAIADTEYGVVSIEYYTTETAESLITLNKKEHPVDMDVILKVYDAFHKNGFSGDRVINIIKAIDANGIMFVNKP